MSNIIAFPVNPPGDVAILGEIDSNLEERLEDARDQIQDIFAKLIAIQNELGKAGMTSVGLTETAKHQIAN